MCVKVTLLLLIARVFSVHPIVAMGIRIFIVLIFLAYVPIFCMKIFICKPISAYWDSYALDANGMVTGENPNCRGQAALFQGDIMISVVSDVLILILPIPMAWKMQAPRWQKIKIIFLLGAGGVATVTTVIRSWLNVEFMNTKSRLSTDAYSTSPFNHRQSQTVSKGIPLADHGYCGHRPHPGLRITISYIVSQLTLDH